MELLKLDTLTWNWPNVSSNVITSDVESILKIKSRTKDDEFDILGEEDKTLEEYVEEVFVNSNKDDSDDIQDISSDDE